jgi:hypothetical protein
MAERIFLDDVTMISEPPTPVLIAASPGPLRDALLALLLSFPQSQSVRIANWPEEILQTVTADSARLVIVVMEEDPAWLELPGKIHAASRDCRVIVLANGDREINSADLVLQQGARPETLVAAFLSMLGN